MARFQLRMAAAALVLLVGVAPSWAATGRASRKAPPEPSLTGEVVRIFHAALGVIIEKSDNIPAPNAGTGSPPPSAPGGATPDIGSSLDPLG